ncbi:MAG: PKD domain-containing protein [Bacteroidia bacterium]
MNPKISLLWFFFAIVANSAFSQTYNMPTSGTRSYSSCSGTVYDPGGSGNYGTNNRGFMLLTPSTSGSKVRLTFSSFNLENNRDYLYVYDGNSTSSTLIGRYTGTSIPSSITASNTNGQLYLYFYSDWRNSFYSGFQATWSCTSPPCSPGTIVSSRLNICKGDTATLNLTNFASGSILQWQGSSDGTIWSNISGANDSIYLVPKNSSFSYFRTVLICSGATSGSAVTNPVQLTSFQFDINHTDSIFCGPDSVELQARVIGITQEVEEDFDPVNTNFIAFSRGGSYTSSTNCGARSGNSFQASSSGSRYLQTVDLDVSSGGTIEYYLKIGAGGSCERADGGNESIRLEYSTNGFTWVNINIISTTSGQFRLYSVQIPTAAQTASTRFRWIQFSNSGSGYDEWAIDDIKVTTSDNSDFVYNWIPSNKYSSDSTRETYARFTQSDNFSVVITDTVSQCSDTVTTSVRVKLSKIDFKVNDTIVLEDTAFFRNTSVLDEKNLSYIWRFGNGDTSHQENPKYVYKKTGTYLVSFVVSDGTGCIDSVQKQVTVLKKPTLGFLASTGCSGDQINFSNTSSNIGLVDSFVWDFGDGTIVRGDINPVHVYNRDGLFVIRMIAKRNYGYADTFTSQINLLPGITADFTVSDACENQGVVFKDVSTISKGFIAFLEYDFNADGTFDSTYLAPGSNVVKNFSSAGTYDVVLKAISNLGCVDTIQKQVEIFSNPIATFTADEKCIGESILINESSTVANGSIAQYEYDFDLDGVFDSTIVGNSGDIKVVLDHNANSSLRLRVTTDKGCRNNFVGTISSKATPEAIFSTTSECVNSPVVFQDLTSANNTTVDSLTYDFNNDNVVDTTILLLAQNSYFSYTTTGLKPIRMIAYSSNGCSDTLDKNLEISVNPIVNVSFEEACAGDATIFTDKSSISSGSILDVSYDFDNDGNYDRTGLKAGATFSHTYTNAGSKTVNIRATSNKGCVTEASKTIGISKTVQVFPNPSPGFTATFECLGDPTAFSDTSKIASGSIDTLKYDFDGDGLFDSIFTNTSQNFDYKYAKPGTYTVGILAISDQSCKSVYSRDITVKDNPKPSFTLTNNCEGETTQFVDQSSINGGSISRIDYDFDNNGVFDSIGINPGDTVFYRYNSFGSKTIIVRATSTQGCINTSSRTFSFSPKPVAGFSVMSECLNSTTQFTDTSSIAGAGTISRYRWFFGDGGSSQLKNPTNKYSATTSYNASLIVVTNNGCRDTAYKNINIRPLPKASFTASNVCLEDSFTLVSSSTVSSGSIIDTWDFGDGSSASATRVEHKYGGAGNYFVKLVSRTPFGCADSITKTITAYPTPNARFSAKAVCLGEQTSFNNNSFGANNYTWNFGVTSSTQSFPSNSFGSSGKHRVELIATSSFGCVDTFIDSILIYDKPVADFIASNVCVSDSLKPNNISVGANFYRWNFGDGKVSSNMLPANLYNAAGTYSVQLVTTNGFLCSDTVSKSVIINDLPQLNYEAAEVCNGDTFKIINKGNNLNSYSWLSGDGNSYTSSNFNHLYKKDSVYAITFKSTTPSGCSDSVIISAQVNEKPVAAFTVNDTCLNEVTTFKNGSSINDGGLLYYWEFGDNKGYSYNENPQYTYANTGNYSVSLVAQSVNNCSDTFTTSAEVLGLPTVSWTKQGNCQSESISFSSSVSNASTFNWTFGDGSSSNQQNPSYTYAVSGTFDVTLTATSNRGCSASEKLAIVINTKPTADFLSFEECLGDTSKFINLSKDANLYSWNFDNGSTSSNAEPSTLYSQSGNYNVRLIAENRFGCKDTLVRKTLVNALPNMSISVPNVCAKNELSFVNNTTGAARYTWQFGDGNTSIVKAPKHIYQSSGTYDYVFVASTNKNCSDTLTRSITVYDLPKVAFTAKDVCAYDSAQFINSTIGSNSYNWSFGDGNSLTNSTSGNVAYKYQNTGTFLATLIATTSNSCIDSLSKAITILQVPVANFNANEVCEGNETQFSNVSTGNVVGSEWSFGDNSTSNSFNANTTYATYGSYSVELVVLNNNGCSDSLTKVVAVNPLPQVGYNVNQACLIDSTEFVSTTSIATGTISEFNWSFGDGFSAQGSNVYHIYGQARTFNVSLEAISGKGCISTTTKSIEVYPMPQTEFNVANVCFENYAEFSENTAISASLLDSVYWQFGDGNTFLGSTPRHLYASAGIYDVTLRTVTKNGCFEEVIKRVNIFEKPVASFNAIEVCYTDTTVFENLSANANQYQWSFGDASGFSIKENPVYQYFNPGSYNVQLIASNSFNCKDTLVSTVVVNENPVANFVADEICEYNAFEPENLSLNAINYEWIFGDGNSSLDQSPSHSYDTAGDYSVLLRATSDKGCIDELSRLLVVNGTPVLVTTQDTTISKGAYIELSALGAEEYVWTPTENLNVSNRSKVVARPLSNTTYTVSATDDKGCEASKDIVINVNEDFYFKIANLITPDGNGRNDVWVIENIDVYDNVSVNVFDRRGRLVYNANSYQNDWDGTLNGNRLADDTYYYVIDCNNGEQVYKGSLTILKIENN